MQYIIFLIRQTGQLMIQKVSEVVKEGLFGHAMM